MILVTISELYSVWFQKEFNDEGKYVLKSSFKAKLFKR